MRVMLVHPSALMCRQVERRGISKKYYLETRADVLLRNEAT